MGVAINTWYYAYGALALKKLGQETRARNSGKNRRMAHQSLLAVV